MHRIIISIKLFTGTLCGNYLTTCVIIKCVFTKYAEAPSAIINGQIIQVLHSFTTNSMSGASIFPSLLLTKTTLIGYKRYCKNIRAGGWSCIIMLVPQHHPTWILVYRDLVLTLDIWHLALIIIQTFSINTIAWFWFSDTDEGLLPETIV